MKEKWTAICIIGALIGIWFSRFMARKYGNTGRIIILSVCLVALILIIGFIVYMKRYIEALGILVMTLPVVIIFVGVSNDKLYLTILGLILIFIIIPIVIKILPRYLKR